MLKAAFASRTCATNKKGRNREWLRPRQANLLPQKVYPCGSICFSEGSGNIVVNLVAKEVYVVQISIDLITEIKPAELKGTFRTSPEP